MDWMKPSLMFSERRLAASKTSTISWLVTRCGTDSLRQQGVPVLNQFTQYLVQRYVEGIPYKGDPLDSFSPMVVDSFRRSAMASTAMQALGIPGSNIAGAFLDKPIKEALK